MSLSFKSSPSELPKTLLFLTGTADGQVLARWSDPNPLADDPETIFDNTEAAWEALKGPYGTPLFDREMMKFAMSPERRPLVTNVPAEWSLRSQARSRRSEVAELGMAD